MTHHDDERLTCFGDDGHLTEEALAALADGQDILPPSADAHATTCEHCTDRIVAFATASTETGDWLRGAELARARSVETARVTTPRVRVPWGAVLAAACLALFSLAPTLLRLPTRLFDVAPALAHAGPVLVRSLVTTLATRSPGLVVVTFAASALLVLVGVAVSRSSRHSGVVS